MGTSGHGPGGRIRTIYEPRLRPDTRLSGWFGSRSSNQRERAEAIEYAARSFTIEFRDRLGGLIRRNREFIEVGQREDLGQVLS